MNRVDLPDGSALSSAEVMWTAEHLALPSPFDPDADSRWRPARELHDQAALAGHPGKTPERVTGIEPALSAWEADVLPLNYTRESPTWGRASEHDTTDRPPARAVGREGNQLR